MTDSVRNAAPRGDLGRYSRTEFTPASGGAAGRTKPVFRRGSGPAVIVLTEMPGITPQVVGFADRLVDRGFTAVLPDLYGDAGRDSLDEPTWRSALYLGRSMILACVSREFAAFAAGRTSPIAVWLRALAADEHQRCGGPGVGAIGMCFSGGFALAMATDASVIAPVLSQPSLPFGIRAAHRRSIDVDPSDLEVVNDRCAAEGMQVLGLRFRGDDFVPGDRFTHLRERLGDGFIAVELDQADGHPIALASPLIRKHHSVLTTSLIDEPGEPTSDALDQVLRFLDDRLHA